jgi:hypothetical protein
METNKEIVLKKYPDAMVCCGDDPYSCVIMRPGQFLSDEFPPYEFDEEGAEEDAWRDAAKRILTTA